NSRIVSFLNVNTYFPIVDSLIFDLWKQDDSSFFISTKACKEVEKLIKNRNLVIVAGHSGSGKSAIIQHIALEYREQGWTVRRVKKVEDIVDEYSSSRFKKNKTICVFNDPLGTEFFDEVLYNSWQRYKEEVNAYLKTAKCVMSCRNHIICDARVTGYLTNQSHIVNIDDNKNKLSLEEKRHILNKYTSDKNLSKKECDEIVKKEKYFPLLCKLYSQKEEYENKGIDFFTEPVAVLKEEILCFRKRDKGKYCALALLVLFNDDLRVDDLLKIDKDMENKFKHTLKLCGLPENTPPLDIGDILNSMKDFYVKKIEDTYHFYHDFVMEVTTYMFGTDYPTVTIKYADIGFLRRRVKLGNCNEHDESFTIYLSDEYIEDLGERLYTELFGERLVDVVLNPCLRNEKVIEVLEKKTANHPENLQMLLEAKKLKFDEQEFDQTSKDFYFSKLNFLKPDTSLENEVSPLFALIVFCHSKLSQCCVNILQQNQIDFTRVNLISAMCCNGSVELFNNVLKDHAEESFKRKWGDLYPIHILSVFHNHDLLQTLIKKGLDVNQKTSDQICMTPLILAAFNDTQGYEYYKHGEEGANHRDETVKVLLSNGADINLCDKDGASPLHGACENGHDSTLQLLLNNGANINLCDKDGTSPLYMACQYGHDSTVKLLLSNGSDIKLCKEDGSSPLHMACFNGHDSTVQLLLSNGADINLCDKDGASPLYEACENGHDSTLQLLLNNGANINLCDKDGTSPLHMACFNGHDSTVQLLLRNGADINLRMKNGSSPLYVACENGHDSTLQLLLSNGADIKLCKEDGFSPLHMACFNGHDSTLQLLLNNGANINLCDKDGTSPLYTACPYGHDSTVKLLLSNGADIKLCKKDGSSPLHMACFKGHDSTVQPLLSNGADINLRMKDGSSPLYVACQNGHDNTVQLLLRNGANINLCDKDGSSPLHMACLNEEDSTAQLLLNNGADINLCDEDGTSPLDIASQFGHDSTVQLLLNNGANINLCDKDRTSPLHFASQNGHDSTVHILLSNGAVINLCDEDGDSPLYVACQSGHDSTVQILLSNGADINLCNEYGTSPLCIACQNGHDRTLQLLLSNGAQINIYINLCDENGFGASPLYIACGQGHDSTVSKYYPLKNIFDGIGDIFAGIARIVNGGKVPPSGAKAGIGGARAEFGGARAEFGGARAEIKGAKAEFGGASAEFGGARAEIKGAKAEFGGVGASLAGKRKRSVK
ncbi:serine/threonine-protein phosphatase 6 regulatory ankyrin repeat subunit C-like, partial [Crassostrea angulata]|uniref:serine/threonine-protein phosphatase 6 regulatory ankyrin repeat subunit C-like n=1 Tax=Magallana angulata TaxID=2784310 RepID=UPI0022B159F4